ncbi:unnamed protein product [Mytilus coruscus]|uniref:C-type lectin domain-containing protein n=1 Tax=Mytilus coruscus TaxID=42192 RepID=A0A6J8BSW3_MYTCO|nr:unnamed protein product [Mytilus coruscus]
MCDTIIWNFNKQMCMLHSESSFIGNNGSHNVTMEKGWLVYVVAFSGCAIPGYDYFPDVNICIKPYTLTKTWQAARTHCQGDGADLITITSNQIRDVVFDYSYCKIRVWVGLRQEQWLNAEPFANIFGPNTLLNNEDLQFQQDTDKSCGTFVMTSSEMKIIDDSCNIRKRSFFICEILQT